MALKCLLLMSGLLAMSAKGKVCQWWEIADGNIDFFFNV